jgi:hypothetical protein
MKVSTKVQGTVFAWIRQLCTIMPMDGGSSIADRNPYVVQPYSVPQIDTSTITYASHMAMMIKKTAIVSRPSHHD